ncbi:MAG: 16S rRNA (cytosine(1402)-N(4))-methyltransferase RsmH [bacterium]|nr:16S rRNA (cytosine(1402)-N(4))-methyltransferase RsmH [bacterium]
MNYSHTPVLLQEILLALQVRPSGRYIDCTFGGGGYSRGISERGAEVLALDVDEDAVSRFIKGEIAFDRTRVVQSNFENVYEVAQKENFLPVDGVVFDLGVSSYQIDTPEKGFSFMKTGPLDMRMDNKLGISAGRLLDVLDEKSLAELIYKFSDEMHSRKIAKAIVLERDKGRDANGKFWENKTTTDLSGFVEFVVGGRRDRIHPATRLFQALRMAVNDEAGALDRGLRGGFECLTVGGRIVVVTFHSGEDRIVKSFMDVAISDREATSIGDIVIASDKEVSENTRSRSAKMRVIEKIK